MPCLVQTKCVGKCLLVRASECSQIQAMLLDMYSWHTCKEILRNKSMFNDYFVEPFLQTIISKYKYPTSSTVKFINLD